MLIEENKVGSLVPHEVGKKIVSMLFNRFFDCLGYIEKDVIWWLFKIKYLVSGILGDRHI